MKTSEAQLWEWIARELHGHCHIQRHEDKYSVGIPDFSYGWDNADGWVELKTLAREPKPKTVFDFDLKYLKPEQRNWMSKRAASGSGRVYLICWVDPDTMYAWRWPVVAPALGKESWETIRGLAEGIIIGRPSWRGLRAILTGTQR